MDLRRPRDAALVGRPVGRPGALLALRRTGGDYGLSDPDELESIAAAFVRWADSDDAIFVVPHVEILARG